MISSFFLGSVYLSSLWLLLDKKTLKLPLNFWNSINSTYQVSKDKVVNNNKINNNKKWSHLLIKYLQINNSLSRLLSLMKLLKPLLKLPLSKKPLKLHLKLSLSSIRMLNQLSLNLQLKDRLNQLLKLYLEKLLLKVNSLNRMAMLPLSSMAVPALNDDMHILF